MPKSSFVTARDLAQYHDDKVKPTLEKMGKLADAMLGDPNNPDKPGYLARFHEVEKAHKTAKRGIMVAGLALATAGGKWIWDTFKNGLGH